MRPLSPILLQKINEAYQTIANNANPKAGVIVSRPKDTVTDSNYWTVETIREMDGLGDISIAPRRFKTNGKPNRLYGIHVHNGEVKTLVREYPDKLKQGWVEQFNVGVGSAVAMAFNGHWERYRKMWRLITDESPFISWVDNNNDLWTQHWDNELTKLKLASDVTKVRMIRAWKNTAVHYLDQGIVAAYIKTNGKVYYRNYCVQEDYSETWEFEKELTGFTGVAVNVNLFITHDYRMGFVIEDNLGQIHWMVTHRNWGGMASPAENLIAGIKDITFEVIPIKYHDMTASDENISATLNDIKFYVCPADISPSIVNIERLNFEDKKTIQVIFNYNLECNLDGLKSSLTLTNISLQPFTIDTISENNNVLTVKTLEEMPFAQDVILSYSSVEPYILSFRISDTCLYSYDGNINLTIDGVPPIGYVNENLTTSITDVIFDVKRVYYKDTYSSENINTSISDISFVVTKVGSNPL